MILASHVTLQDAADFHQAGFATGILPESCLIYHLSFSADATHLVTERLWKRGGHLENWDHEFPVIQQNILLSCTINARRIELARMRSFDNHDYVWWLPLTSQLLLDSKFERPRASIVEAPHCSTIRFLPFEGLDCAYFSPTARYVAASGLRHGDISILCMPQLQWSI